MSAIVFDREQARRFVDAALSASSTDDVTPVICGAHIIDDEGVLRVVSTDRYRVHTAVLETKSKEGPFGFIIPRSALLWLASNIRYYGSYAKQLHRITIHTTLTNAEDPTKGGRLTVTVAQTDAVGSPAVQWVGELTPGTFPPVSRLLVDARAAEPTAVAVRLNPAYLGKLALLARFGEGPRFKFTASANPSRPGPVYVAFVGVGSDAPHSEALIQPMMEGGR